MAEDYYTQYCREHTNAEARAFLIDQCRKADTAIASLETRLAEAEGAIVKKDEALRQLLVGAKHESCLYGPDDPDPTWHCCNWSEVVEQIEAALSLTPACVKQEVAYARVGRAVEEWVDTMRTQRMSDPCADDRDDWDDGYDAALRDLGRIIAKAREGGK